MEKKDAVDSTMDSGNYKKDEPFVLGLFNDNELDEFYGSFDQGRAMREEMGSTMNGISNDFLEIVAAHYRNNFVDRTKNIPDLADAL